MSEYLTPEQLAERLTIPIGTLANWRCAGRGPRFTKLEGRVRYLLDDVLAWEAGARRYITDPRNRQSEVQSVPKKVCETAS